MTITQADIDRVNTLVTDPSWKIGERPVGKDEPLLATIRELDLTADETTIHARYSKALYRVDVANYGGIGGLLRDLAMGNVTLDEDGAARDPYKSQLSLKNDSYCYVIMVLAAKNWQFSHDKAPFSIGELSTFPKAYYEARKADLGGNVVNPAQKRDDCKIAYFIADGVAANSAGTGSYSDPFNFHLEYMDEDSDGDLSRVPLIIDPDVRFPGGSGEP